MRERPSPPADVTVSELLYTLAIRAPRQGESEGGERREGRRRRREGAERDEQRMTEEERVERERRIKKKGKRGESKCVSVDRGWGARWQHINGL